MNNVNVIAFDADDTLWHTEVHFQEVQRKLVAMLQPYAPEDKVNDSLNEWERRNIPQFGYGIKGFILSMVETAIEVSDADVSASDIGDIIALGKGLFEAPLHLMDGVEDVLRTLGEEFRLFLITKGDVLDQRAKIERSGLERYFERIEVVQEKDPATYANLFDEFDIAVENVAMVGNSLRSDILPVLELNGAVVYIPYHVTAHFEIVADQVDHPRFHEIERIADLPDLIRSHKTRLTAAKGRKR